MRFLFGIIINNKSAGRAWISHHKTSHATELYSEQSHKNPNAGQQSGERPQQIGADRSSNFSSYRVNSERVIYKCTYVLMELRRWIITIIHPQLPASTYCGCQMTGKKE